MDGLSAVVVGVDSSSQLARMKVKGMVQVQDDARFADLKSRLGSADVDQRHTRRH